MKQRFTYTTKTSTTWPVMPTTVGAICIIMAGDYSRDNKGVLNQGVS